MLYLFSRWFLVPQLLFFLVDLFISIITIVAAIIAPYVGGGYKEFSNFSRRKKNCREIVPHLFSFLFFCYQYCLLTLYFLSFFSQLIKHNYSKGALNLDADNNGVGTAANGINYEVRVLLFQALHTMIERSMALDGFVRFGRWFTRPLREPLPGRQHLLPQLVI